MSVKPPRRLADDVAVHDRPVILGLGFGYCVVAGLLLLWQTGGGWSPPFWIGVLALPWTMLLAIFLGQGVINWWQGRRR